jgi:hypothetical protein
MTLKRINKEGVYWNGVMKNVNNSKLRLIKKAKNDIF